MSIPQTVTEILREHVTLEVESIDRMYLNLYVPKLQYEGGRGIVFPLSPWCDLCLVGFDGADDACFCGVDQSVCQGE